MLQSPATSNMMSHQNRPTFHLSPQLHLLQRPIITQQGHHLIQGGLIRQLIPGTILQQFQQSTDLNVSVIFLHLFL
jgi:hypothetical protein